MKKVSQVTAHLLYAFSLSFDVLFQAHRRFSECTAPQIYFEGDPARVIFPLSEAFFFFFFFFFFFCFTWTFVFFFGGVDF